MESSAYLNSPLTPSSDEVFGKDKASESTQW